jgi:hypothetical protein
MYLQPRIYKYLQPRPQRHIARVMGLKEVCVTKLTYFLGTLW